MSKIYNQKMTVELDDEVVVFIIGMRINKWWKVRKWWPVFVGMPRMLKELTQHPELGMIHYKMLGTTVIQYWRSYEQLEAYARSKTHLHLPAWKHFNQKIGHSNGDVGIWHETYRISSGQFEAIYGGMPVHGLAHAGRLVPIGKRADSSRERMYGAADVDDSASGEPVALNGMEVGS